MAECAALLGEPNIVLKCCFQGGYCSNGKVIGVCWTNIQVNSMTYYSVVLFLITIIQPNCKCMTDSNLCSFQQSTISANVFKCIIFMEKHQQHPVSSTYICKFAQNVIWHTHILRGITDFCPWSCRHSKRDVVNINNVKNTEDYCVDDCVMLCYPVTQFFHNYGFLFIVRIVWWSYWESLI